MTTKEAAAILGMRPASVKHWCQSDKLKAVKRGRDWWILKRDIIPLMKPNNLGRPRGS